jgi:hypothetical protein
LFYLLIKENNETMEDEAVRKDIQILSSRLYDLRERFMKIVHKINRDANGFVDQISEEGKRKHFFFKIISIFFS